METREGMAAMVEKVVMVEKEELLEVVQVVRVVKGEWAALGEMAVRVVAVTENKLATDDHAWRTSRGTGRPRSSPLQRQGVAQNEIPRHY